MVPGCFLLKGDRMDKQLQKALGYAVLAVIAYFILQALLPFLWFGIIALIAYQVLKLVNKQ